MREATLIRGEMREHPAPLAVTRLWLTDFRCYASLRMETDGTPVVLFGPNGAGKTNLLEALSLLVPGRGLRRARQADLLRHGAATDACWAVAASVSTAEGEIRLGTGRDPRAAARIEDEEGEEEATMPERRLARIDGETSTPAKLGAVFAALWLTPEMDRLFLDGASGRRRFLDRAVYGLERSHATRVNAYERAMRERARLLRAGRADPLWLDALEERMASEGVAIAATRIEAAARISKIAAAGFGPFPGAVLALEGSVEESLSEMPALEAEMKLRQSLLQSRGDDALTGGASFGPHRSDLRVYHRVKNLAAELCSTGEQKALMIGMVLAIASLIAQERGCAPLLLLDEVAAHLDSLRRGALFEHLTEIGAQFWLTGTERETFGNLGVQAQFFRVGAGAAMPA